MAPEANHDPVSVIIAAFFLYRYMAVAQGHDPEAITEWSKAVSNYVKEKRLDDLCAGRNPTATLALSRREEASPAMTHEKKTHMARLMLWTFYEDIFASIKGYGGALARHFVEKPERSREIYQYSCAELESVWGADYPEREILDDVENAPIISFLYEVITLYAEVNRAVSSPLDLPAAKSAVEEKIDKLEARSRSLIRLTTMNVQPRSRVMINADYMVPLFYALRIYCFRSFLSDDSLATPSPPAVQSSVSSILQLAQRSLSRGPLDPMQARFQWPLFMAGIETTDRIHKEWAHSKLRTASMSIAFQTIVCLEEETQRRTPMPLVRQLMDTKNSAIPM
ncbi:hypothetical protein ISF_01408 [Cordyceps fumosorosea ARSEF 2679]|uniref:C6 finger domain protein n=1 Tax=Cordyceps fumosorosea (strain ARSEF 2679) TaxID=1081104 RepID=A0A168D9S2_CORFA|nr:hypothetical protein ISF_01408 [Cordyceps fumosorosea ARSEF 2679]OAA72335.1 hypothetical protein ISF_01408 [Cordyceps fumosorosea ARSEF 2679]